MQFLWKYIDDLVGKGLDSSVIAELLFYTSAGFVPLALPLAILLASLMTFGNLGENNELLAMKSAGISLQRIMSSLIALTIALSILAFFFANNVLPVINLHASTLLRDIRRQRPELSIRPGVFYNGIEGYSLKIDQRDPETALLKGIKIYNHTDKNGNNKVTVADSGYMKITNDESKLIVTLYSGKNYYEVEENIRRREPRKYPHQKEYFDKEIIVIPLEGFGLNRTDKSLYADSYQMMTITQLSNAQDSIKDNLKMQYGSVKKTIQDDIDKNEKFIQGSKARITHDTLNIDPYKLFEEKDIETKKNIIEKAISNARISNHHYRSYEIKITGVELNLKKHLIQWHEKITLAFACFIFFFIGAPLGAIIRKGGLGTPIVVSVIFFLIYYMISLTGKKMVVEGIWGAFSGMWLASIILFVSGVFLTYKATTDSVILNADTYINFVKNIFKIKKRKKK